MAYYQLSKVLKMRRTVLGYSQEDFDVEGPTGMTVYRIEKGKNTTTKHTYHNLTNAMGIKENTRQGILKTNDITLLLLTNEVSDLISQGAFHNAQDILEEIEKRLDNTVLRNQQYINYIKNKLLYLQKELQDIDYELKLKECITYGPKNFKELGMKQWPFHEREWQRLFALEKVLRQQKKI